MINPVPIPRPPGGYPIDRNGVVQIAGEVIRNPEGTWRKVTGIISAIENFNPREWFKRNRYVLLGIAIAEANQYFNYNRRVVYDNIPPRTPERIYSARSPIEIDTAEPSSYPGRNESVDRHLEAVRSGETSFLRPTEDTIFSLGRYIKTLNASGGPLLKNRFLCVFTPPQNTTPFIRYNIDPFVISSQILSLFCFSASFPGRAFESFDSRYYGPSKKFPLQSNFDEVSMSFVTSSKTAQERRYFDAWQDVVQNKVNWNMEYRRQYATPLEIHTYDVENNFVYGLKLHNAWPSTVQGEELDVNSAEDFQKVTVTFSYDYWTPIVSLDQGNFRQILSDILSSSGPVGEPQEEFSDYYGQ